MSFWSCDICRKQLSGKETVFIRNEEIFQAFKNRLSLPSEGNKESELFTLKVACLLLFQFPETNWRLCEECHDRLKEWQDKSKLQTNLRLS